jgi:hypothetical protein
MGKRVLSLFLSLAACADASPPVTEESLSDTAALPPAFHYQVFSVIGAEGSQTVTDGWVGSDRSFLVGRWDTTVDFSAGHRIQARDTSFHPFFARMDMFGRYTWGRGFLGTAQFDFVTGTPEADLIVAGGRVAEDDLGCGPIAQTGGFLVKYAGGNGACLWMRVWPTTGFYGITAVHALPGGDLAVAGRFSGTVDLGGGQMIADANDNPSVFVARLDARGHARWARVLGDPTPGSKNVIRADDMTFDAAGSLYVTGTFERHADLSGQVVDVPAGATYLVAFDGVGQVRWRYVDRGGAIGPVSVHTDAGRLAIYGRVVAPFRFAGEDFGITDPELIVLDFSAADGHQRWAQTFTYTGSIFPGNVVVDGGDHVNIIGTWFEGDVHIGDTTFSASGFAQKIFIAVLDANDGTPLRANSLGEDFQENQSIRMSFGPTGLRLMTGDISLPDLPDGRQGLAVYLTR